MSFLAQCHLSLYLSHHSYFVHVILLGAERRNRIDRLVDISNSDLLVGAVRCRIRTQFVSWYQKTPQSVAIRQISVAPVLTLVLCPRARLSILINEDEKSGVLTKVNTKTYQCTNNLSFEHTSHIANFTIQIWLTWIIQPSRRQSLTS